MELKKITTDQLVFTGEIIGDITDCIVDDRVPTWLHLADYDWMTYVLETRFTTQELGTLEVIFKYMGEQTSFMNVKQLINDVEQNYEYEFATELFEKHIVIFLAKHLRRWKAYDSFNGEKEVLAFYNDVIEYGNRS